MRQEQPKKKRERKKVPALDLTYEEKAYIKLLWESPIAWSTIYCITVKKMIDKGLLELSNHDKKTVFTSRVSVSKLGKELYANATKGSN